MMEFPTSVCDDVSTTDSVVRLIDSTTEGAAISYVCTTKSDPSLVLAGSRKWTHPLVDSFSSLCATSLLHQNPLLFTAFVYIGENCTYFFGGWKNGL